MSRAFIKLSDGDKDYYLRWSTVVDAPITYGMSLDEVEEYYRYYEGENGVRRWLREGKADVEARGHEFIGYSVSTVDELIAFNRAGANETCFSKEQIIEWYCRRCQEPTEKGKRKRYDEEGNDLGWE